MWEHKNTETSQEKERKKLIYITILILIYNNIAYNLHY